MNQVQEAREYVEWRTNLRPKVAVVLGSGLGAFADELQERVEIPYSDIPGWPRSTALGHAGKLVVGKICGLDAAVMAGRVHLYEGWTAAQVTFSVRVLGALGVPATCFLVWSAAPTSVANSADPHTLKLFNTGVSEDGTLLPEGVGRLVHRPL